MNLNNLDIKIDELDNQVKELSGSIKTLEKQYADNTQKLSNLKDLQVTNLMAIELLNLIQKVTKDLIKDTFENIITQALQFIYQDSNYSFELEFDRHGNTPKLRFLVKSPDMQEAHEIVTTRAGGCKDIVALALRLVLLEASKNTGFLFLDEPFKRLDNEETINKAMEFIKEVQKNSNRQIFIITHEQEVVDSVLNSIVISNNTPISAKSQIAQCSVISEQSKEVNIEKSKRGRKPKNVSKD